MRRPWKLAVALKTLVDLLRRHEQLRLIELHPGGGGYDCLGLRDADVQVVCQFNLAGTSLAIRGEEPPSGLPEALQPDIWRYPKVWLEHDLAARLAERARLPERGYRSATPATVALGVVAEVAARLSFSDADLDLRAGWHDSSGMEGSFLRKWCPPEPTGSRDWKVQARWGGRFWSIGRAHRAPGLVLDLATGTITDGSLDLWSRYRSGEGIRRMAARLEQRWRTLPGD